MIVVLNTLVILHIFGKKSYDKYHEHTSTIITIRLRVKKIKLSRPKNSDHDKSKNYNRRIDGYATIEYILLDDNEKTPCIFSLYDVKLTWPTIIVLLDFYYNSVIF